MRWRLGKGAQMPGGLPQSGDLDPEFLYPRGSPGALPGPSGRSAKRQRTWVPVGGMLYKPPDDAGALRVGIAGMQCGVSLTELPRLRVIREGGVGVSAAPPLPTGPHNWLPLVHELDIDRLLHALEDRRRAKVRRTFHVCLRFLAGPVGPGL